MLLWEVLLCCRWLPQLWLCLTRFTKPLKGKFQLPKSLGRSLSHPGGSVLPVLLLGGFSEPGLDKHPVMIIPCHSQLLTKNHLDLIPEQILPGHSATQSSAPARGQEPQEQQRNGSLYQSPSPFPVGPGVLLWAKRPRSFGCFPCAPGNLDRAPAGNPSWGFCVLQSPPAPA